MVHVASHNWLRLLRQRDRCTLTSQSIKSDSLRKICKILKLISVPLLPWLQTMWGVHPTSNGINVHQLWLLLSSSSEVSFVVNHWTSAPPPRKSFTGILNLHTVPQVFGKSKTKISGNLVYNHHIGQAKYVLQSGHFKRRNNLVYAQQVTLIPSNNWLYYFFWVQPIPTWHATKYISACYKFINFHKPWPPPTAFIHHLVSKWKQSMITVPQIFNTPMHTTTLSLRN